MCASRILLLVVIVLAFAASDAAADFNVKSNKTLINTNNHRMVMVLTQVFNINEEHFQGVFRAKNKRVELPPNSTNTFVHSVLGDWEAKRVRHMSYKKTNNLFVGYPPDYTFGPTAILELEGVFMGNPISISSEVPLQTVSVDQSLALIPDRPAFQEFRNSIVPGSGGPVPVMEIPLPGAIPTLSEWGLILLALLLLTVGTVCVSRRQSALGLAGGMGDVSRRMPLIVPDLLARSLLATIALASAGCVGVVLLFGSISPLDVLGTVVCAGIVGYWVHFVIASRSRP